MIAFDQKLTSNNISTPSSDSSNFTNRPNMTITTPSFVKSLVHFLTNLLALDGTRISYKLQDYGLIKLFFRYFIFLICLSVIFITNAWHFFRCICNPNICISDTKKLSIYCEVLEMNTAICILLIRIVGNNDISLGTVLHTRDCLNVLISLLDIRNFGKWIILFNRYLSEVIDNSVIWQLSVSFVSLSRNFTITFKLPTGTSLYLNLS